MSEEYIDICKISTDCNNEELKILRKYQDSEIEHKDPENYHSRYFNEAIGDIFRELSKCYYNKTYIQEKLKKLKTFGNDTGGDELERCEFYINNKERLKKDVINWINKLDEFKEKVKNADIDTCRKQFLLKIPELQKDITRWGSYYYMGTKKVEKELNTFIKRLELTLE